MALINEEIRDINAISEVPTLSAPSGQSHENEDFKKNPRQSYGKKRKPNGKGPRKPGSAPSQKGSPGDRSLLTPLKLFFPIYIHLRGLFQLVRYTHSALLSRDRHISVDLPLLQYISYTAAFCKIMRVEILVGKYSALNHIAEQFLENLKLPSPIADYIDAIGTFKLPSGAVIMPSHFDAFNGHGYPRPEWRDRVCYQNPLPRHLLSPQELDGLGIQIGFAHFLAPQNPEFIHGLGISSYHKALYISGLARMEKCGKLRPIIPGTEGNATICCATAGEQGMDMCAYAPFACEELYARKSLAFSFHMHAFRPQWPAENQLMLPPLFRSKSADAVEVIAELSSMAIMPK